MKKLNRAAASHAPAHADIEKALQTYETALKAADIDTIMSVFAPDGVFMPPNSASAVGADAVRAAYGYIFEAISFDIELKVEEIVQVAPDWAFVRTSSSGSVTVHAAGARVPDANHELFVFHKNDAGAWNIARYSFSTTLPARQ